MIPFTWIYHVVRWAFWRCGDCHRRFNLLERPVYRHIPHDGSYPAHYECRDLR